MPNIITEDMIEQAAIAALSERHGYSVLRCFTEKPDDLNDGTGRSNKRQAVLPDVVRASLLRLNPGIPEAVVCAEAEKLCRPSGAGADLMKANFGNYNRLRDGITVQYEEDGRTVSSRLRLVDFDDVRNNDFTVASQMWMRGEVHWRRPDLLLFVNGLPLVFIELKNGNIAVKTAYDKNLRDYLRDVPFLFDFNQICVLSNGLETRLGSFSSGYEYFFEWLKKRGEKESPDREAIRASGVSLEYFIDGLCRPEALLDYIENFVLFDRRQAKIIAKCHQYFGVNNAFNAFLHREERHGKLGVFWHTQGSGKSFSMVMLARKIMRRCPGNFTFLVVTDRDDLDGQIYKNFLRTGVVAEGDEVRPGSGAALREALKSNRHILFTLIQKFRYDKGKKYPLLSDRSDIIVIVDEAHRTQYKDLAENMRTGLPNAQYLAFTGTPLLGSKRLTNSWFGDYVSEYNFAESIRDNATVPLYYVKRVPEVELLNTSFDDQFAEILEDENLTEAEHQRLENHYAKELEVLRRDDRLDAVAKHIVFHFPRRGFLGKGMVISVDKFTAVRMYEKVSRYWKDELKSLNVKIARCEDEREKAELRRIADFMRKTEMAVVISEDADEAERFAKEGLDIRPIRERMNRLDENGADIEDNFKNPDHPLRLVFVCAMWLTGFDAPSVSTLYLDKPMKGHTLMQTIARANRVFPGKECGLIVDYLDVFKYLKRALADYASDDGGEMPVKNVDRLLEQLNEAVDLAFAFCREHGASLDKAVEESAVFQNLSLFEECANTLLENDDVRQEFIALANTVHSLYEALRPDIFKMGYEPRRKDAVLYLQGVIEGRIRPEKIEAARARIDALLDVSVITTEDARTVTITGKGKELDLSKLDIDGLRAQFKRVKYKNLEIANLREFIAKKLERMLRRNVTRVRFSERFRSIIDAYNAGGSRNDDFYEKLLKLMEELKMEEERHIKEELSEEELELFDLLRREHLSAEEEKKVKLAAKALYATLTEKRKELFIIGWQNDPQPKERVRNKIIEVLDRYLPECYDKDVFSQKSTVIFDHIVDQAMTGYNWFA